jgi:UDP-2,3-diacylglucosamine pyrophosphatase LpxH
MLVFSDLHLKDDTAELVLGTILPEILKEARVRGEKRIACLGDVLHFRYRVPAPLLNGLRDWCLDVVADGTELIFLPGNHDQYDITGRNALEPLASIPSVQVHTHAHYDNARNELWLPYRRSMDSTLETFAHFRFKEPPVCYAHAEFQGAFRNDGIRAKDGLSLDRFRIFRWVLSGHYHQHHTVRNVTYVGSPYQTRVDESNQAKGFVLWDGADLKFVERHWGKRYHRIELAKGESLDLSQVAAGDDVRVKTAVGVDPQAVGRQLEDAGIGRHTVTPEVVAVEQRLQVSDGMGLKAYAEAYADLFGEKLNRDRLMEVYREVVTL